MARERQVMSPSSTVTAWNTQAPRPSALHESSMNMPRIQQQSAPQSGPANLPSASTQRVQQPSSPTPIMVRPLAMLGATVLT